jgi:subtilase family serine protease
MNAKHLHIEPPLEGHLSYEMPSSYLNGIAPSCSLNVAGVADNGAVYFQQQWGAFAGTSVAAPIWATVQALVNEDTIAHVGIVGDGPQLYYAVADENAGGNAYFDVTTGDNLYYPATPGWDYATGLGTPNLANFDQAVFNTLQ